MAHQKVHLYPQMSGKGPFTVEASGYQKVEGESIPRRHPISKDKLVTTPNEDVRTIYDILSWSADKFGNAKALGSRRLVKTHNETKMVKKMVDGQSKEVEKQWSYAELGPYEYMSFIEYRRLVLQLGSGLRKIGMQKGDRVELFAATSPYWLGMSHAAVSQSMPIATAYDTLGESGLRHSLKQTRAKAVYCDPHLLKVVGKTLDEATDVTYIIYNPNIGDVKQADIDSLKKDHEKLIIMSVEELRKAGEDNMVDPVAPEPEDLCCIMYTSGSTGPPKGVPLKHKSVLAASACHLQRREQTALTVYSRRRDHHRWTVPGTRRRLIDVSPPRAHPRIRLRKRLLVLGRHHGLRQPTDALGPVRAELQGRHPRVPAHGHGRRAGRVGVGAQGHPGQGRRRQLGAPQPLLERAGHQELPHGQRPARQRRHRRARVQEDQGRDGRAGQDLHERRRAHLAGDAALHLHGHRAHDQRLRPDRDHRHGRPQRPAPLDRHRRRRHPLVHRDQARRFPGRRLLLGEPAAAGRDLDPRRQRHGRLLRERGGDQGRRDQRRLVQDGRHRRVRQARPLAPDRPEEEPRQDAARRVHRTRKARVGLPLGQGRGQHLRARPAGQEQAHRHHRAGRGPAQEAGRAKRRQGRDLGRTRPRQEDPGCRAQGAPERGTDGRAGGHRDYRWRRPGGRGVDGCEWPGHGGTKAAAQGDIEQVPERDRRGLRRIWISAGWRDGPRASSKPCIATTTKSLIPGTPLPVTGIRSAWLLIHHSHPFR